MDYFTAVAAIVAAIILFDRGLALLEVLVRTVGKDVPACKVLDLVRSNMLYGFNGLRSIIYHRESGGMIIATKYLSPNYGRGAVRLRVALKRVSPPRRWRVDRARGFLSKEGNYWSFVWYWHLPSCRGGEVLLEEECGASITRLQEVIQRLIADEQISGSNPVFYIWSEGGAKGSRINGVFQDLQKT